MFLDVSENASSKISQPKKGHSMVSTKEKVVNGKGVTLLSLLQLLIVCH